MYIHPFILGVVATLALEFFIIVVYAIFNRKDK